MRRCRFTLCVSLAAAMVASVAVGSGLTLTKEVNLGLAPAFAELVYTVTVAHPLNTPHNGGLLVDVFPEEVDACAWTCTSSAGAVCEAASGNGDIEHIAWVPFGTWLTYEITCVFAPSPGQECAFNVATLSTMDPDTITIAGVTTCEAGVTVFFDDFESGDTSAW